MLTEIGNTGIIFTNKAKCRDCYKCVRACPVKAIKMYRGQASVDESRCILCGKCIKICPQQAKCYRNDIDKVKSIIRDGGDIAASIAPSFAAVFSEWERKRLPAALKILGYKYVEETSAAAYLIARESASIIDREKESSHFCTACPSFVNYIEKYKPHLTGNLIDTASPMILHARWIKQRYGKKTKVVHIGPCIAKKHEAERYEYTGLVDAAITFAELEEWMEEEKVVLKSCEESGFDLVPPGYSALFPLSGGLFRSGDIPVEIDDINYSAAAGFEEIKEACDYCSEEEEPLNLEALMCVHGCLNGPGIKSDKNIYKRKADLLNYFESLEGTEEPDAEDLDLSFNFIAGNTVNDTDDKDKAKEILAKIGRGSEDEHLNCGGCGYNTCYEKAFAVLNGMAEAEVCIPHMRHLAEQRTDRIIETSPNGTVILDDEFTILHINPSFMKFFKCSESVIGKKISFILEPEPFEELAASGKSLYERTFQHKSTAQVFHQFVYMLKEEKQYVSIFVDITKSLNNEKKLNALKTKTVLQAQELLNHQIEMAQKLAKFLGESTAKGEALVDSLIALEEEEEVQVRQKKKPLWDTYTSK